MAYELLLILGIIAIIIGTVPIISISFWRFGFKRELWYSWLLGGLFWALALITSVIPLMILRTIFETTVFFVYINILITKVFETLFRVLLFILFTKFAGDTSEKVMMAGIGWGTFGTIFGHTIPVLILIVFLPDYNYILQMDGIEYIILFGGYKRFLSEIFHLVMMIMTFYGIKGYLKNDSEPMKENFFSRDPKPVWIWIILVYIIHIIYDFLSIILPAYLGLYIAYLLITVFIGVLFYYILKRVKVYPLFNVILLK